MHKSLLLLTFFVGLLTGCMSMPSSINHSAADPSNPSVPESSARPLHPKLVAATKVYLDRSAGQGAEKMDMSKMQGMDQALPSAAASSPASKQGVEIEMKKVSDEMKQPSGELSDAAGNAGEPGTQPDPSAKPLAIFYTCPMHSQIHEVQPGQCPICGMTLVKRTVNRSKRE